MKVPKSLSKEFSRAELIFYISPNEKANLEKITFGKEQPWYCQALTFYAHVPFNYNTFIAQTHTIPDGKPVVEGSQLTTALFLSAIFERPEFKENFYLKKDKVNLLWLTYLTDKETEYKLNYGFDKLVDHFNEETLPQVFDPFRPSII